ncbi:MAG: BACON domain-containing protein, partial [Caldilineaceae bacterium]|nr:BACON domain-containing protein [Caldilineaceae bacterium]
YIVAEVTTPHRDQLIETQTDTTLLTSDSAGNDGVDTIFTLQGFAPFPPIQVDTGTLHPSLQTESAMVASPASRLYMPIGYQNNGPLARISIPCTKDCAKTCEVCLPNPNPLDPADICAPEPVCYANCQAERSACWTLVDLYKGYFTGRVQDGVTYSVLAPQVKNAVAPYIAQALGVSSAELDEISVGGSAFVSGDNAMTDCDKITWPAPAETTLIHALGGRYKSDVDIRYKFSEIHWVYHEFVHTFQCDELGGRTEYAYNWWSELPQALIDGNGNPKEIHDNQPSEQNADARADLMMDVMPAIIPRYITSIKRSGVQKVGETITLEATAKNVVVSSTFANLGTLTSGDRARFIIYDENDVEIKRFDNLRASGTRATLEIKTNRVLHDFTYVRTGKYTANWTIPEQYAGANLTYQFQIHDTNGYLMDESSARSLSVVKRFVYVNAASCIAGNEQGTVAAPYCTISAALADPDIRYASIRIAAGEYPKISINQKVVLESSDGVVGIGGPPISYTPPPPTLELSVTLLGLLAEVSGNSPTDETFSIRNSGSGTLSWTATESISWLSLLPTSGTAPSTVIVAVDSSGLPEGDYIGDILISAGGQSKVLTVALRVVSTDTSTADEYWLYLPFVTR